MGLWQATTRPSRSTNTSLQGPTHRKRVSVGRGVEGAMYWFMCSDAAPTYTHRLNMAGHAPELRDAVLVLGDGGRRVLRGDGWGGALQGAHR
jgi:hypothetical protein